MRENGGGFRSLRLKLYRSGCKDVVNKKRIITGPDAQGAGMILFYCFIMSTVFLLFPLTA